MVTRHVLGIGGSILVGGLLLPACECGKKPPPPPAGTSAAPTATSTMIPASPKRPGNKKKVKLRTDVPKKCRTPCWVAGLCALKGNMCVAVNEKDCRSSHGCKVNGMCTFEGQACIGKSDEDCRKSERCKSEGLCKFVGEGATNCRPGADEDCAKSDACEKYNRCVIGADGYCDDPKNPRKVPSKEPVPE